MGRLFLCVLLTCALAACGQSAPAPSAGDAAGRAPASPLPDATAVAATPAETDARPTPVTLARPTPTPGPSATPNALVELALSDIWTSTVASDADTWLKVLRGPSDLVVSSAARTSDGATLVAGYVPAEPLGLLLAKVRDDGSLAWGRVLSGAGSRLERKRLYWDDLWSDGRAVTSIVPSPDGGAAIAFDDMLVRVDGDGGVLSSTAYVPPEPEDAVLLTAMVPVGDGYLLAGELVDPHQEPPDGLDRGVVLIRTRSDGSLAWARRHRGYGVSLLSHVTGGTYLDRGALLPPIARLALRPDGRPVLGTYRRVPNPMRNDASGVFTKTAVQAVIADVDLADGSLGPTHELRILSPGGRSFESPTQDLAAWGFQAMAFAPDGDLVVALGMDSGDGLSSQLGLWTVLARVAPDGTVRWAKRLSGGEEPNGDVKVRSIGFAGDDIVLAGATTEFLSIPVVARHPNVLLARVSPGGDVAWVRSIGLRRRTAQDGPAVERGMGLVVEPDGHLVVAGFGDAFSTEGRDDILVIRAGANGAFVGDGELANLADFGDRQHATWKETRVDASAGPPGGGVEMPLTTEPIRMSGTDAGLTEASHETPCTDPEVRLLDGGQTLRSTCSIFVEPDPDPDGDGIDQAFESTALALTSPLVEVDEEEDWLNYRADYDWLDRHTPFRELHHAAIFTRVFPWPTRAQARWVLFESAVAWSYDYGGLQTSTPLLAVEDHRGDSEKVFEAWRVVDAHTLRLEWVQTSAHDSATDHTGTWRVGDRSCNRGSVSDLMGGVSGSQLLCGTVRFRDGRVIVEASEDKHAVYLDTRICKAVQLVWDVYGENCGWDPSRIPIVSLWQWEDSDFDDPQYLRGGVWRFHAYDVGEPDPEHQLVNDLGKPWTWRELSSAQVEALTDLFPGESIWDGNLRGESGFCGGLRADGGSGGPDSGDPLDWFQYADKCSGTIGNKFKPEASSAGDRQLFGKLDSWYRVSVATGRGSGASTGREDGPVSGPSPWITLVGDGGRQSTYELDGEFDAGGTDVFHVAPSTTYGGGGALDHPVGPIRAVKLRLAVGAPDPDWLVTRIDVTVLATGETWTWHVPPGRWVRSGATETFVATPAE